MSFRDAQSRRSGSQGKQGEQALPSRQNAPRPTTQRALIAKPTPGGSGGKFLLGCISGAVLRCVTWVWRLQCITTGQPFPVEPVRTETTYPKIVLCRYRHHGSNAHGGNSNGTPSGAAPGHPPDR